MTCNSRFDQTKKVNSSNETNKISQDSTIDQDQQNHNIISYDIINHRIVDHDIVDNDIVDHDIINYDYDHNTNDYDINDDHNTNDYDINDDHNTSNYDINNDYNLSNYDIIDQDTIDHNYNNEIEVTQSKTNQMIKNLAMLDTPPTYPAFGMMHVLKPKIHNQITSNANSQIASYNQITSILPNMLSSILSNQPPTLLSGFNPYLYPYSSFYYQIPQFQATRSNISLKEFFSKLD
ncbi:4357_t:CDS:2 [Dentiscutata heterogama]|uniref:4357_t:CDS:1 n=1 Tax=Dentiscutata heterogama TaxID=1316150 RepID=A0ACA9KC71_9GLOM|nr:4357_t:CDS:2 [Dentiscutata heterogama]